jgi:hypothetical protein
LRKCVVGKAEQLELERVDEEAGEVAAASGSSVVEEGACAV